MLRDLIPVLIRIDSGSGRVGRKMLLILKLKIIELSDVRNMVE